MIDSPLLPDRRTFGSDGAPYTAASKDLMERTAGFTGFYSSYDAPRIIMGDGGWMIRYGLLSNPSTIDV
jgi:hypothetical protein